MPPEPGMLELMAQIEARVAALETMVLDRTGVLVAQIALAQADIAGMRLDIEELQREGDDARRREIARFSVAPE
jgi:hypothetical protein